MNSSVESRRSRGGDDAARRNLPTPRRSKAGGRPPSSETGDTVGGWPPSDFEWLSADTEADTEYDDVDRRLMDTFPASDAVARY